MPRKPLRKFLPLTYQPKIPGVMDSSITQTIRIDTGLAIGDFIAFHGWEGRPYRSPWSFRTPYFRIVLAKPINVHADYVYLPEEKMKLLIGDPLLDKIAAKDGIDPPTGKELVRGLHAMHGPGTLHCKVIRWEINEAAAEKEVNSVIANITLTSIMPFDGESKAEIAPLAVPVLNARPLTPDPLADQIALHFLKVRTLSKYGKEQPQRRDIPAASQ